MHEKIVHYHIFKNAGTSVDSALRESFDGQWAEFDGPHADSVVTADQVSARLASDDALIALSTHQGRVRIRADILPILFLRHPIVRARSVFEFTKRNRSSPPPPHLAGDFADYVAWALESRDGGVVIRDYQVVHLSQASFRTPLLMAEARQADLQEACDLLTRMGKVGIVERFDHSIRAYQSAYQPLIPGLKLEPKWENATSDKAVLLDQRLADIRSSLGGTLYNGLVEANRLDLELYAVGLEVMEAFALQHSSAGPTRDRQTAA